MSSAEPPLTSAQAKPCVSQEMNTRQPSNLFHGFFTYAVGPNRKPSAITFMVISIV